MFSKKSKGIFIFARGHHWVIAITYQYALIKIPSEIRKYDIWTGNFEGPKRHLHLHNWNTMLVDDIKTKWLRFKTVLLDLVEKFS